MKIEEKYISLKLAKKLQKVAVENDFSLPDSKYVWTNMGIAKGDKEYPKPKFILQSKKANIENGRLSYPAHSKEDFKKIKLIARCIMGI